MKIYEPGRPKSGTWQFLKRNCQHDIFELHNKAVDDFKGTARFRDLEHSRPGASRNSLEAHCTYRKAHTKDSLLYEVDVVPLQEASTPDVTFMKLDYEGSEIKILSSEPNAEIWKSVRRVFVEVSAKRIRLRGEGWHPFGRILKSMAACLRVNVPVPSPASKLRQWKLAARMQKTCDVLCKTIGSNASCGV